jgi:capsular polysaccharide biosynthesis protein
LFDKELVKELSAVSATREAGSWVSPSGQVLKGLTLNPHQFNIRVGVKGLLKTYRKAVFSLLKLRSVKKLDSAYYVTNSNSKKFFHWFLDVLQKLEFMERNHRGATNKAVVIIPSDHQADFMMSSLSAFDFRFFLQDNNQLVLVKKLTMVPDLAPTGNYRKEVVLNLRKRLRNYFLAEQDESMQMKRVYITRKNAKKRKIINEDDLLPKLREFGFEIIDMDALGFKQQIRVMLGAEMLVSLHGAGLTHMLWMKDRGKVLEIRASGDCHNNCYFTLASDLELDYYYSLADKTDAAQSTQQADYIIDPRRFEVRLGQMVE